MAALFEVRIAGEEEAFAAGAAHEAFAEADRMEALLSRFLPHSEIAAISRLAPGESLQLSEPTAACLAVAIEMERLTLGAFSIHATALRHGESLPRWELDSGHLRVLSGACHFDLGAIGKGFALDRMAAILREWGAPSHLIVSGGSSVLAGEAPSGSKGWSVSVGADTTPTELAVQHSALGASGLSVKGNHITDPRTGQPATTRERAWVLAGSAAEADALSTACMVLSDREIESLAAARPDITIWITTVNGLQRLAPAP